MLGNMTRAGEKFEKSMQNMQKPFFVWTESTTPNQHKSLKDQGCYNFLTGTGGFIQSLVYGYGGIRFKKGFLEMSIEEAYEQAQSPATDFPDTTENLSNELTQRRRTSSVRFSPRPNHNI